MSRILDGVEVAKHINEQTIKKIENLKQKNIFPCIATIRVGNKDDAIAYQNSIKKKYEKLNITVKQVVLDENISKEELKKEIEILNENNNVHGIMILRPLPKRLDENSICNMVAPKKDIDGMTDISIASIIKGENKYFAPCTPEACIELLKYYNIPLDGKNIVVLGRSTVVGKPLAMMLLKENATVTVCHTHTKNTEGICKNADILIVAVGKAKKIGKTYLREGQTIVDVGINVDENNKLCGDVNFEEAQSIVEAITPVPKGIGSVTTAILAKHLVQNL